MTRGHHPTPHPSSTTQPGRRPEEEYSTPVTRYRKLFLVRGKAYHTLLSPGQQNRQTQAQLPGRKHTRAPGAASRHNREQRKVRLSGFPAAGPEGSRVPLLWDHPSPCRGHQNTALPVTSKGPPYSIPKESPFLKSFFIVQRPLAQCRHLTLIPGISGRVDLVLVGNNPVPKCIRNKHRLQIFPGLTMVIARRRAKKQNSIGPEEQSKARL